MHKLYLLFILFLCTSFVLSTQELDQNFLESVPANIREDLIAKSNNEKQVNKNITNPDTRIINLENALNETQIMLENIQNDLQNTDFQDNSELKRFGDSFFRTFQSTFIPINEPNVNNGYVLDSGDRIKIQLIGQKNQTYNQVIERNGSINIPEIGEISLAGLSLKDASNLIKASISNSYIGVEAYISLTELRDMNVLVVGNVLKPGMYTLGGGSSVLSLIYAAGGIGENGSYRRISHKRNNILLQNIDLYEVLINGNILFKNQLRSGDVLIVHPRLPEVRFSGYFANPGIYEINNSKLNEEIFEYIGSLSNYSDGELIIERSDNQTLKTINLKIENIKNFLFEDGDTVHLLGTKPEFSKTKSVVVKGEVLIPGTYIISDNTTLLEVIDKAGSYTNNAYPMGGILIRKSVKELEERLKDKSYNELLRFLISSPSFSNIINSPSDSSGILTFLSLLKDYEPSGRLVAEFYKNSTINQNDRILEDGDTIYIPAFTPDVYVFGEVMNPGAVPYKELASPSDYVKFAGGFSRVAMADSFLLISPNGEVEVIKSSIISFINSRPLVMPGSTIYVPRQVGKLDGINLASTIAPIVSSVALSLASLNAINN
jgi:protein involved in polysaccharide export with SLBB domain